MDSFCPGTGRSPRTSSRRPAYARLNGRISSRPGTRLDRWLFSILHSIWLNEIRAARYRQGEGLVDAESALVFDGIREIETNILAAQVLKEVQSLPEAQRETVFLVYGEGLTYREAAEILAIPIGTVMSRLAGARVKLAALASEEPGHEAKETKMIDETYSTTDSHLLAYVDGALSPSEREALEARLAGDPALKARLAELAAGGRPFAEAYDVLLRNAPRERLAASLERARATFAGGAHRTSAGSQPGDGCSRSRLPSSFSSPAARSGSALRIFCPIARSRARTRRRKPDGWRAVVAEYLTLYTRDTLANMPDDRSLRETELKSVGDKLALGLSVDKVALDGLALKRSQLFDLDGRPLAQIAYLTPDDGPVAFCIIADGEGDRALSFEERQGKNIVYWSKGGHAFMLIGNLSRSTLETLAASLAARVA